MAVKAIPVMQALLHECRGCEMGCAEVNADMEAGWQFAGNGVHVFRDLPHQALS